MTVTSVSALSIDPPTLIVSLNRQSSSWPIVKKEGRFAVNFLGDTQRDVAERFTGKGGLKGADRFLGVAWQPAKSGVPLLIHALATSRLRGGRSHRAAFARHHHRRRTRHPLFRHAGGAGLLAGRLLPDQAVPESVRAGSSCVPLTVVPGVIR